MRQQILRSLGNQQANLRNSGSLQIIVLRLKNRGHILSSQPSFCAALKPEPSQDIIHKLQAIPRISHANVLLSESISRSPHQISTNPFCGQAMQPSKMNHHIPQGSRYATFLVATGKVPH